MQKLVEGIHQFQNDIFSSKQRLYEGLVYGHLRTHPTVAAALGRKALNLHGWVYEFETGQVFGYHSQEDQFVPIEGKSFTVPSAARELPSM